MCHFDAPSSYLWLDYSRPGKSAVLKMPDNGGEGCGGWSVISPGNNATLRVHCLLGNLPSCSQDLAKQILPSSPGFHCAVLQCPFEKIFLLINIIPTSFRLTLLFLSTSITS